MVIPFDEECRKRYYKLLDQVFDSNMWSDGKMQEKFEELFSDFCGLESCAVSSGGTGLVTILDYIGVEGKDVVVPANTFWATAMAAKKCGANIIYADCNKDDLCISMNSLKDVVTDNTKAVIVVHIGGHIAFQIEEIKEFCEKKGIVLIEDCAHAHGADWNGRKAGSWGLAGSYSFYATKTIPLGEGGMIVSKDKELIEFAKKYRNYGKEIIDGMVTYPIKNGFNYRINEITAALGIVQMEQTDRILEWKKKLAEKYDRIFDNRVRFPEGMTSGYYKYIVFDYLLKEQTGKVFGKNDLGYRIEGRNMFLENSEWVVDHHKCVPIFYGWEKSNASIDELKKLLLS